MKRFSLSIVALSLFLVSRAQNIGIGIATPRAKLHIFQGASGNVNPYSPVVVENNAHTYVNLLSPDANERGILFGNSTDASRGGIIYNNSSTLDGFQFRTAGNQTRMVITNNGYVGIGTTNPIAPLGFPATEGRKITLYPGQVGATSFAVHGNTLQISTHDVNGNFAFGYDLFNNFNEGFTIKANGALVVNGTTGTAGQVLQSNGAAAPSWTTPANPLYNNTVLIQNTIATLVNGSSITIPVGHTFTTNTNAKVLVTFSFPMFAPSCFLCGNTGLYLLIYLNGNYSRSFRVDVPNAMEQVLSGNAFITVGPGTHTISFMASRGGPDIYVGHSGLIINAVYQIIPQ